MQTKLVIASNNTHKIKEFEDLLAHTRFSIQPASSIGQIDWQETGKSFAENAKIKVETLADHSSLALLSDDSGLVVEALAGAPGIHSSRYAGEKATDQQNLEKLLDQMKGLKPPERKAYFICCLCYKGKNGRLHFFEGKCHGSIAESASGVNGFGYDPIFIPEGQERSLAEYSEHEKNLISHRRRAMDQFLHWIQEFEPELFELSGGN